MITQVDEYLKAKQSAFYLSKLSKDKNIVSY